MGYYDSPNENLKKRTTKIQKVLFILLLLLVSNFLTVSYALSIKEDQPKDTAVITSSSSKELNSTTYKGILEESLQSVVGIISYESADLHSLSLEQSGSGSGVIYKETDNSIFIVTNYHVIAGAESIEIKLFNNKQYPAEIVGTDQLSDLAVLKMENTDEVSQIAKFGNSNSIGIGDNVYAIGNPLGFLDGTVTKGIISSNNRNIPVDINKDGEIDWQADVIQTDASINPGNSGGALINEKGEVIGINSSKIADAAVEGIGFSIPINTAKPLIDQMESKGKVLRPYLGIEFLSLSQIHPYHRDNTLNIPKSIESGVVIDNVQPNSPADKSGLQRFDVIIGINKEEINNSFDLRNFLYNQFNEEEVKVHFYRNNNKKTTILKPTLN